VGRIRANVIPGDARVIKVDVTWPTSEDIDSEIIDDLGSLPNDANTLETERRNRVINHIRAGMDQPGLFDEQNLSDWLDGCGVSTVSEYFGRSKSNNQLGAVKIVYSPPSSATAIARTLPVTAGILVRDKDLSLTSLLSQSKSILSELERIGMEQPVDGSLYATRKNMIIWIVPEEVFDDDDWPGGEGATNPSDKRKLRRLKAGTIFGAEGIGLAAV
jgi:hypothetical protein